MKTFDKIESGQAGIHSLSFHSISTLAEAPLCGRVLYTRQIYFSPRGVRTNTDG